MAEGGDGINVGRHNQPTNSQPTNEEKLKTAYVLKSEGNEHYKNKAFKQAVGKYHRSLLYLRAVNQSTHSILGVFGVTDDNAPPEVSPEVQAEVALLQTDCYNNLAACMLQYEKPNYEKIVQYCDKVLEVSPNNLKAMYRKGVAYYHLKKYESGYSVLIQAKDGKGKQKDPAIDKYLLLCKKEMDIEDKKMKETFKGMFDRMSTDDPSQNT